MYRRTGKSCRQTSQGQIRPQGGTALLVQLIAHIISSCTFAQPQYKRSYLHICGRLNFTVPVHYCSLPVYTAALSPFLFPYPIPQYKPCCPTCLLHNAATHCSKLYKMSNIRGFQELSQLSRGRKFFPNNNTMRLLAAHLKQIYSTGNKEQSP